MERHYTAILSTEPENARALAGKAAALAWQGRYSEAKDFYARALAVEPGNTDTRVGLGYAHVWDGDYASAHTEFQRVLRDDPGNLAARKGIGYAYLWSGNPDLALASLDTAAAVAPSDAEVFETRGRARIEQNRPRDAIAEFDRALELDPDRRSARDGRVEAYRFAPALELLVTGGATSGAGSGLRRVEVSHWPSRKTRFFGRYDNSLGLDIPSIANRNVSVPTMAAGVGHRFASGWTLDGEIGQRDLPDETQNILGLNASAAFDRGVLKLGGQISSRDLGSDDRLLYAGWNFPLANNWRLEPMAYLAELGAAGDSEWRLVVNGEHAFSPALTLGAFIGGGRIDAREARFDGDTSLAGGWLRYEPDGRFAIILSARHEDTPAATLDLIELGAIYRIAGN